MKMELAGICKAVVIAGNILIFSDDGFSTGLCFNRSSANGQHFTFFYFNNTIGDL